MPIESLIWLFDDDNDRNKRKFFLVTTGVQPLHLSFSFDITIVISWNRHQLQMSPLRNFELTIIPSSYLLGIIYYIIFCGKLSTILALDFITRISWYPAPNSAINFLNGH